MIWTHNSESVDRLPENVIGFVYLVTTECNKQYIGMKPTISLSTKPARKSNPEPREGMERVYKIVRRDSNNKIITSKAKRKGIKGTKEPYDKGYFENNWKTYSGSSTDLENYTIKSKEILEFAYNKTQLRYLEEKHLFKNDVLESDNFINQNIGGRYFKSKIQGDS